MCLHRKQVLLVLLACGLTAVAYAQSEPQSLPRPPTPPRNVKFDHLPEHLYTSTTVAIQQDRKGFMWFATSQGGLTWYDGYTARRFTHDPNDPKSLSSDNVWTLYEDAAGTLWAGTRAGLNRFDSATETFTRFQHDDGDPNSVSSNDIGALLEDREGRLWVGTGGFATNVNLRPGRGLNRFDRETEAFTPYRADKEDPTSISDDWIGALLEDRNGRLWVGSWGLNLFDPQTETFEHFLPYPDIPEPVADDPAGSANWVASIYEDGAGRLWVGTYGGGLYLFDPKTGRFTNYRNNPRDRSTEPALRDIVYSIVEDPEGDLWLGTRLEGLVWFDPKAGTLAVYRHDSLDRYSLGGEAVRALYKDRQGIMWAGTFNQPVDRFDRAGRPFEHIYSLPGDPNSLRLDTYGPLGIYEGPDGALWVTSGIASSVRILNRIDRESDSVQHFTHDPTDPNSLRLGVYRSVFVDSSGVVWTGGRGVLSRMEPDRPGYFIHYRHNPDDEQSLPPGQILIVYEDRQGHLWVGSTGNFGLSRLDDPERGRFTRFPFDAQWGGINSIYEDREGIFWVGIARGGLVRFDPETGTYTNYLPDRQQVFGVCESPLEPGVLWAAVYLRGLARFDMQSGTFTYLTTQNSRLPDNGVQGVLCDDHGQVWVSTDYGITRFDPGTDTFENFDLDNGLQGLMFNSWAYHKSPYTGELFFGGKGGVNAFFPDDVRFNTNPPEVVLTGMRLFDEPVSVGGDSPLARPLSETEAITLRHHENDLTFDYVGLHFANPAENRYKYMLEPYDDDWRAVGSERRAVYTNLPPDAYTFRVEAANSDGVWSEAGTALHITIRPPWWQTWWAYTLYGLLFVASVFGVDRLQRRRLIAKEHEKARARELEQARVIEKAHLELQQSHEHLKTTQAQLVQQEKMASLGQLTARIAHEIKNPLNFVNNFAEIVGEMVGELDEELETLEPELPDGAAHTFKEILADLRVNSANIEKHGKRADGIVHAMMQHASGGSGEREATDINHLVSEHIELAYHGKRAQMPGLQVKIKRDLGAEAGTVEMVPQEIGRVLLNLLGNAFDAVHEKADTGQGDIEKEYVPTVTVSTRRVNDTVEIRVADNGPGIPIELKEKIYEPFFTTKPTGSGTGLGLSLSYDIVTQGHGGALTVESKEGEGATFVIMLPA